MMVQLGPLSIHILCPLRETTLSFYDLFFSLEPCIHVKYPKSLYSTLLSVTLAKDAPEIYTQHLKPKPKRGIFQ